MSKQAALKACPLFKGFSESGMAMMEKITRERKIPANTPIFVEDMVAESMFVVMMGVVMFLVGLTHHPTVVGVGHRLDPPGQPTLVLLPAGRRARQ